RDSHAGMWPTVHSVLAVFLLQRNLDHPKMDGASTNLALIFGTLLSSQGADASFVPVSRPSGRFLRYFVFPA
ncbi:hypothetical protein, partial [Streptomyces sp. NPDC094049]|uniref:hypothetical protein n=1 Tax=Streptomyces sp. NPDC094049 TaxID=3154987 RepID=UPI003329E016